MIKSTVPNTTGTKTKGAIAIPPLLFPIKR